MNIEVSERPITRTAQYPLRVNRVRDEVLGWVEFRLFQASHAVAWRWRKRRGLSGDFDAPEDSRRAAELTATWERQWPGAEPLSYMTYGTGHGVRFHSLPASKRYADSDREYEEILRRQRAILDDLRAGTDLSSLIIVAADWSAPDLGSGSSRRHLPDAWPWRIGHGKLDPEAPPVYFWVQQGIDAASLDNVLRAGADDQGRFLFTEPNMTWLFCPYDGGVDVLLPTAVGRDAVEARYADWLPDDGPQ